MSDDWVKQYLDEHSRKREERRQKEEEAQKRRDHAEAGASGKFHQIRARVDQDLRALRDVVPFQSVEFDEGMGREFTVMSRGAHRVELKVSLNGLLIRCDYSYFSEGGLKGIPTSSESKTLRISSDIEGRIVVYKNGSDEVFAFDSEVSEFLLTPMLKYISQ